MLHEAHGVERAELETLHHAAGDGDEVAALGAGLAGLGAAALRVAGVDDPRGAVAQHLPPVDVAERPVVHAGGGQVAERAGRVGGVLGGGAHIGVQQADVKTGTARAREAEREVLPNLAPRVADAVHDRDLHAVELDGDRLDPLRAEDRDAGRPPGDRRPAVQRIVVAVDDEGADAGLVQTPHAGEKADLRAQPALGAVVDVAGEEHEQHLALERQVDEPLPRLQGRLAQGPGHAGGRPGDALERRIQMKVGGVYEAERVRHRTPSRDEDPCPGRSTYDTSSCGRIGAPPA
ncbi:MAG: hypothetical protein BWY94_00939 [Actinobacteria bacterium ADurb.BinA094]|nr:MAG: hypothetical protein BWY94_00939 [Actinobacteria bacterium ADurb.BinA094]